MTCLTDYILLDGVPATVTPNSGLYVNRELTIPLAHISGVINKEQDTLAGVWAEIQAKGIKKFIIRLRLGMMELFSDCSPVTDDWVCLNREALAMPLVYFLGSELMLEIRHTNRINRYTTIDKERAAEMRDEFDKEFALQLKAALQAINSAQPEKATPTGDVFTYLEVIP